MRDGDVDLEEVEAASRGSGNVVVVVGGGGSGINAALIVRWQRSRRSFGRPVALLLPPVLLKGRGGGLMFSRQRRWRHDLGLPLTAPDRLTGVTATWELTPTRPSGAKIDFGNDATHKHKRTHRICIQCRSVPTAEAKLLARRLESNLRQEGPQIKLLFPFHCKDIVGTADSVALQRLVGMRVTQKAPLNNSAVDMISKKMRTWARSGPLSLRGWLRK